MPATLSSPAHHEVNTPEMLRRVNALRTIDNFTNWFYLVREWLILGSILALTIAFFWNYAAWGLSWWWNVPVAFLAVILIGACQHRLTNLTHEASHYMLFRNRLLNELVSDWLCMFPMLSCTHHYRLQHLAHHQFPNDPERDPDIFQMAESGHRYEFPMSPGRFVWECVIKQLLWFPKLIRYIRVRAKYNATGMGKGPYRIEGQRARWLVLVGILYLLTLIGALTAINMCADPSWQPLLLAVVPAGMWAASMAFYGLIPARMYLKSLVKPDVAPRWMTLMRITFLSGLFTAIAWLTYLTEKPWALWYVVLWLVPLVTTFSFFMILRQVVQHGNAGQDRLTNTRIFKVNRLIQLAVFPLGMDWHLPHHIFPMVPHYRLRELHELLMETEAYRQNAVVVEGYFFHRTRPPQNPSVVDLMSQPQRETQSIA
jgi:fatty acid desaturase